MSENKLKSRDAIDAELKETKAELAILNGDTVKDILNTLFSDLYFCRTMQNIFAGKVKPSRMKAELARVKAGFPNWMRLFQNSMRTG
ncbi:MAG: hypothetical protein HDT39_09870 [Lachnospiraceae bacterium]|nr:hypothetical protein [Lachnospiraceae bacterium]